MEYIENPRLWKSVLRKSGYRLGPSIGHGAFGDVFSVTSRKIGTRYAIKRLVSRRDITKDESAWREIQALAEDQENPGVIRMEEVLLWENMACIVMELATCGNLEMVIRLANGLLTFGTTQNNVSTSSNLANQLDLSTSGNQNNVSNDNAMTMMFHDNIRNKLCCCETSRSTRSRFVISDGFIARTFVQVTLAIEFCHSRHIAHRDINPSNILVFDTGQVKITDFGLSFRCKEATTRINDKANSDKNDEDDSNLILCCDYLGQEAFLAPEVLSRKPFHPLPADVWSLGRVLLFMVTKSDSSPNIDPAQNSDSITNSNTDPNTDPNCNVSEQTPLGSSSMSAMENTPCVTCFPKFEPKSKDAVSHSKENNVGVCVNCEHSRELTLKNNNNTVNDNNNTSATSNSNDNTVNNITNNSHIDLTPLIDFSSFSSKLTRIDPRERPTASDVIDDVSVNWRSLL